MHKLESEAERAKVPLEHMTLKRRNNALSFSLSNLCHNCSTCNLASLKYIDTR